MRSLEQLMKANERMFRKAAPDLRTIENWVAESDDKATNAAKQDQKPGQRVDDAHDAVLLLSLCIVALQGWRIKSEPGHHVVPIEAACSAVGTSQGLCDRLLGTAKLRNDKYDGVRRTEKDGQAAAEAMIAFRDQAEPWLRERMKKLSAARR